MRSDRHFLLASDGELWHALPNTGPELNDFDAHESYSAACVIEYRRWARLADGAAGGITCLQCLVHLARGTSERTTWEDV